MERLALPGSSHFGDVEINSHNLVDYLMYVDDSAFVRDIRFARELDLGWAEPYLRSLYESERVGYVYPEGVRTLHFPSAEQIEHPVLREIEIQRQKLWQEVFSRQGPVERYRSIYYDSQDGMVKISSVTFGEANRVNVDTLDLVLQDHVPLFEIHSHPKDSLFSPIDYQRLIINVGDGLRMLKGAILICPNVQLLALVTPKTKFVPTDEANAFVDHFDLGNENSEIGSTIRSIDQRIVEIINQPFINQAKAVYELDEACAKEARFYDQGLYTFDELKTAATRIQHDINSRADVAFLDDIKHMTVAASPLRRGKNILYNQFEWEAAREVNPKLYMGTDFRHFKAFSD